MERLIVAYGVFLPVFGILMIAIVVMGVRQRRWQVYVGAGWAALLPVDSDRSAKHIRDALRARTGVAVGVGPPGIAPGGRNRQRSGERATPRYL